VYLIEYFILYGSLYLVSILISSPAMSDRPDVGDDDDYIFFDFGFFPCTSLGYFLHVEYSTVFSIPCISGDDLNQFLQVFSTKSQKISPQKKYTTSHPSH